MPRLKAILSIIIWSDVTIHLITIVILAMLLLRAGRYLGSLERLDVILLEDLSLHGLTTIVNESLSLRFDLEGTELLLADRLIKGVVFD